MASGRAMDGVAYRRVLGLLRGGTVAGWSDADLLERFRTREGEVAELAFAALVERHGTMVLRTCRAALGHLATSQADDAFQAVFLVLARRAGSLRAGDSIGPWLRQVALRVCRNARRVAERRASHEMASARDGLESRSEHPSDGWPELHEELHRLPSRFREPLALCYLDGLTHDQAAARLGWPLGTVRSRLARGRERLKAALLRRGVSPAVALSLHLPRLSPLASALVPHSLRETTIRNAVRLGRDASTALPAGLALLVGEGIRQTTLPGIKLMLTLATAGLFSALVAFVPAQGPGEPKPAQAAPAPRVLTIPIPSPGGKVRITVDGPDGQETYAIVADGKGSFEVAKTGIKDQFTEIRTLHADGVMLHPGPLRAEARRVNKQLYDASEQVNFRGPEDEVKILSDRVALRQKNETERDELKPVNQLKVEQYEKIALKFRDELKALEDSLASITLARSNATGQERASLEAEERHSKVSVEEARNKLLHALKLLEVARASLPFPPTVVVESGKKAIEKASSPGSERIQKATEREEMKERIASTLSGAEAAASKLRDSLKKEEDALQALTLAKGRGTGAELEKLTADETMAKSVVDDIRGQLTSLLRQIEEYRILSQSSLTLVAADKKAKEDLRIKNIQKQAMDAFAESEDLRQRITTNDHLLRKLVSEINAKNGREKENLKRFADDARFELDARFQELQAVIKRRDFYLKQLPEDSTLRISLQKQIEQKPPLLQETKPEETPKPNPGASVKPTARELTADQRIRLEQIDKKLNFLSQQRDILDAERTWHNANRRRLRLMEAHDPKPTLSDEIRKSELRVNEIEDLLQVSDQENAQLLTDRVQLLAPDADRNSSSNRPRLRVVIRGDRESKVGETHEYRLLVSLPGPPLTPGTLRLQLPENVKLLGVENRSGVYNSKTRVLTFDLESIQPDLEIGVQLRHTAPGLAILHARVTANNLTGTDSLVTKVLPR